VYEIPSVTVGLYGRAFPLTYNGGTVGGFDPIRELYFKDRALGKQVSELIEFSRMRL